MRARRNLLLDSGIRAATRGAGRSWARLATILASIAVISMVSACQSDPGIDRSSREGRVLYVSSSSDCAGQQPCYASIQEAVDAAAPEEDVVKVAEGIYTSAESQVVAINKSVDLIGGYGVDGWSVPFPEKHQVILDAEGMAGRRGISIQATEGGTVTVRGLTIRRGLVRSPGGAGVHVSGGSVVLEDIIIEECSTDRLGGGVLISNGDVWLRDSELRQNKAQYGSGLYVKDGSVLLERNTFAGNEAPSLGGVVAVNGGEVTGTNNLVVDNPLAGAGVYLSGGELSVSHWTLVNNGHYGVVTDLGIDIESGSVLVRNSIIAQHSGGLCGSGAVARDNLFHNVGNPCIAGASCSGSFFGDPRFLDPSRGDYRIAADSAAVDQAYSVDVDHDMGGHLRPAGRASDLGAYEVARTKLYLPFVARRAVTRAR